MPSTSTEIPRRCDACGTEEGSGTQIKKCTACKSALYCSTECQRKAWKAHRPACKRIQAERRAAEPPLHSDVEEARVALGRLLAEIDGAGRGRGGGGANLFVITNKFAEENMRLLRAGLAYDPSSFVVEEGSETGRVAAPYDLYDTLAELSRRDAVLLRSIAARGGDPDVIPSIFPSHHLHLAVVRWRPTERGYEAGPDPRAMRACPSRSAAYLRRHFPDHLALCAAAWDASRSVSASARAALYHVCKDLWRMLPITLCVPEVAEAVLKSHGPFSAEDLADLTRMFDLGGEANDLEGLTNQTAAVLFCQARRINRKAEKKEGGAGDMVQSAAQLENLFTSNFDEAQLAAWKGLSVPVADEMCRRGRGLANVEFANVMNTIGMP